LTDGLDRLSRLIYKHSFFSAPAQRLNAQTAGPRIQIEYRRTLYFPHEDIEN
jgi:hypothetical protein